MHVRVGTHHANYPTVLNNAVPDVELMAFSKNAHHVNKGSVRLGGVLVHGPTINTSSTKTRGEWIWGFNYRPSAPL